MKVLIINAIYGSRSSGRSIADITEELQHNNHTAYVATPDKIDGAFFYQIGDRLDHKIHAVMSRLTGLQSYFSQKATKNLIQYIEKINPDIIHMQVIHGNYLNFKILMQYVAKKKIPMVFVLDDCWYFTGKCCHYTSDKCYKWKTECHNCPRKSADNPSWFFDFSRKMYRDKKKLFEKLDRYAVVAVSDWLKNQAQESYLKNATYLTKIYNAIDIDKFQYRGECAEIKEELGITSKKVVLGVATSWKDSKGLSKGISLFIELAQLLPDDFQIVLIGKMDSEIILPKNIVSVDFVDGAEELSKYYSMADVFVQMSSEETFGKVTAEALCCGTPAIVFDSTANPELIGENCGYVVENKNVQQVYEKILEIIERGKRSFFADCRKFAVQNFESKKNAMHFMKLYEKLINGE